MENPLPTISAVTVSFNQGEYLEQCLRSVLEQSYPCFEYIVIDGGSTDGSVDILKRYDADLSFWVSEPDSGQADGLNKGFSRVTGDIIYWLNSDDMVNPGAFERVARIFSARPDVAAVVGHSQFSNADGIPTQLYKCEDRPLKMLTKYWLGWPIPQPSVFFRRSIFDRIGGLDSTLNYVMDMDIFLRMRTQGKFMFLDETLSVYRLHDDAKTGGWKANRYLFWREADRVVKQYWGKRLSTRYFKNWLISRGELLKAYYDWKRLN